MTDNDFSKKILRIATMQERLDLPFKKQQEMILLEVSERTFEFTSPFIVTNKSHPTHVGLS
jgi:hypothetical protein